MSENKLVILLTASEYDKGKLTMKLDTGKELRGASISYISCTPKFYFGNFKNDAVSGSLPGSGSDRLLFVVEMLDDREANTKRINQIVDCYQQNYEVVIGTHTKDEHPSTVLEVVQFVNKKIPVTNYSTGMSEFSFVTVDLFSEFTKLTAGTRKIQIYFDKLFETLKKKPALTLVDRLGIIKHRLAHFFLPIDIDLQGLAEAEFTDGYWTQITDTYRHGKALEILNNANRLLKGDGPEYDTLYKVIADVKKIAPEGKTHIIAEALKKVEDHLTSKAREIAPLLIYLGFPSKKQEVIDKSQEFHKWFGTLNDELDNLRSTLLSLDSEQKNSS